MSNTIDLKISHAASGVTRKVTLPANPAPLWPRLAASAVQRFSLRLSQPIGLRYTDADGDVITLSSQLELDELWDDIKAGAKRKEKEGTQRKIVRVELIELGRSVADDEEWVKADEEETAKAAPPAPSPRPTLQAPVVAKAADSSTNLPAGLAESMTEEEARQLAEAIRLSNLEVPVEPPAYEASASSSKSPPFEVEAWKGKMKEDNGPSGRYTPSIMSIDSDFKLEAVDPADAIPTPTPAPIVEDPAEELPRSPPSAAPNTATHSGRPPLGTTLGSLLTALGSALDAAGPEITRSIENLLLGVGIHVDGIINDYMRGRVGANEDPVERLRAMREAREGSYSRGGPQERYQTASDRDSRRADREASMRHFFEACDTIRQHAEVLAQRPSMPQSGTADATPRTASPVHGSNPHLRTRTPRADYEPGNRYSPIEVHEATTSFGLQSAVPRPETPRRTGPPPPPKIELDTSEEELPRLPPPGFSPPFAQYRHSGLAHSGLGDQYHSRHGQTAPIPVPPRPYGPEHLHPVSPSAAPEVRHRGPMTSPPSPHLRTPPHPSDIRTSGLHPADDPSVLRRDMDPGERIPYPTRHPAERGNPERSRPRPRSFNTLAQGFSDGTRQWMSPFANTGFDNAFLPLDPGNGATGGRRGGGRRSYNFEAPGGFGDPWLGDRGGRRGFRWEN